MKVKLEDMDNKNLIEIVRNIQENLSKGWVLNKLVLTKNKNGYVNGYYWDDASRGK